MQIGMQLKSQFSISVHFIITFKLCSVLTCDINIHGYKLCSNVEYKMSSFTAHVISTCLPP